MDVSGKKLHMVQECTQNSKLYNCRAWSKLTITQNGILALCEENYEPERITVYKAGTIYKGEQLLHKQISVTLHSPPDMKYHNLEHKQENAYTHVHSFSINSCTV